MEKWRNRWSGRFFSATKERLSPILTNLNFSQPNFDRLENMVVLTTAESGESKRIISVLEIRNHI